MYIHEPKYKFEGRNIIRICASGVTIEGTEKHITDCKINLGHANSKERQEALENEEYINNFTNQLNHTFDSILLENAKLGVQIDKVINILLEPEIVNFINNNKSALNLLAKIFLNCGKCSYADDCSEFKLTRDTLFKIGEFIPLS